MVAEAPSPVPRLRLRGMRRSFGAVQAVDGVDLDVAPGSVHALLGENGAGKSTLMNIVYGIHRRDAGTIAVDGRPLEIAAPADAIAAGLAMVHQHHMLVPSLTVAETIALATRSRWSWNRRAATARVRELAARLHLDIDPAAKVTDLSLAGRQRVEILTAVHRDARLLVLDEPTAILAPSEVDPFFALLRRMADQGCSIILITHRMREVFAVCDTISVMRKGRCVFTGATAATTPREVLGHVVTTPLRAQTGGSARSGTGDIVLEVDGLHAAGTAGTTGLDGCSLAVRSGEILGVAGVEGNGQGDLVAILAGVSAPTAGDIRLAGVPLRGRPRRDQLTVVPEDRHREGLVLEMTVAENLALDRLDEFTHGGLLRRRALAEHARRRIREYAIVASGPAAVLRSMSGGNQQKVVLARALGDRPTVLVASQATRGLDPGAAGAVLEKIREARDLGTGVLFIGADLDEVIELADRVVVLYGGRVTGESVRPRTDRARIAGWMVGNAEGAA
ncbi:MAG: ABC transporter ATP-binding protein [Microbacterium sp.]